MNTFSGVGINQDKILYRYRFLKPVSISKLFFELSGKADHRVQFFMNLLITKIGKYVLNSLCTE